MFYKSSPPLLYATPPYKDESLTSYLLRISEQHNLRTPMTLLKLIHKHKYKIPGISKIEHMSELFGCHPDEIKELFGFEYRDKYNNRVWKIDNEWITKSYFISSLFHPFCPKCLSENNFLRSVWELNFYTACPRHNVSLVLNCPSCNKPQKWRRPGINTCICGGTLSNAKSSMPTNFELYIACLIENKVYPHNTYNAPSILSSTIEKNLEGLSLDSLFKTLWLIGYLLPKNLKPNLTTSTPKKLLITKKILNNAFNILSDWPNTFNFLVTNYNKINDTTPSYINIVNLLGPVHRYITSEITDTNSLFVKNAYERQLRNIWIETNRPFPKSFSNQLEFEL